MEATATTSKLLLETGRYLAALQQRLGSDEDFQVLARQLGWDIPTLPAPLANLLPQLVQLDAAVQAVVDEASLSNLTALKTSVTAVFAAIKNLANETYTLSPPSNATDFKEEFPEQLLNVLLVEYLQIYHSQIYGLLYGVGLITREYVPASAGRMAYIRVSVNLHLLADLLRDPVTFWRAVYGWGTTFAYDRLVMAIRELLDRLGVPTGYLAANYDLLSTLNSDPIPISEALPTNIALQISLLHTLTSLGELYLGIQLLPILSPTGTPQGVAVAAQALGALNETTDLGDNFFLTLAGVAGLEAGIGLTLQPTQPLQVKSLANANATVSGKLEAVIQRIPDGAVGTPQLLLRTPGNTELTYETITWKVGALASTTGASDLYTELRINALRFASGDEDNDSFLSQVLKNFNFKTDLSVGLSKAKGFYFDAAGRLSSKQIKNVLLGPVQLNNVSFAVRTVNSFTYLIVVSDVQVELGPVQVGIIEVGMKAGLRYDASGGSIGPFSPDIAVKTPTALGISIDTGSITGGGYLYFDLTAHRYAGVANLKVRDKLTLNAIGLLQTELPDDREGYSLLLLITASQFNIQLGLGFTLNGIGGLVGVNRAANIPFLRSQVYTGGLDQLLFPANVLDNPQAALTIADNSFPAAEVRYVFGLMAKIGWGTPTLITLDLGLIIELPAPVRLVILGILRATLPDAKNPIIRLRADFLGSIDFGAKRVEFDATLTDSSILEQFTLSGDGAFRLYQGQNPVFLLTTGGFHPAFQPPANANLPALRRLQLALADSRDFRLILQSYLAVTANTVQIGSRLDLFVDLPAGFSLEGYLLFDTLFQFNPFHLLVQIGAGVAIKRNGKDKLSIHLQLVVSGPAPWHVTGEISFKIVLIKIKFRLDKTFGRKAAPQPLPDVSVRALLQAALQDPGNWEVELPATRTTGTVVLSGEATTGRLLIDPNGALVVRQKVTPLSFPLERYGNARPTDGSQFDIQAVQIGSTEPLTSSDLGAITDFFAPGEYRNLTEAQRLSAPSFQLMPSGVRLTPLQGFTGGPATVQQVGYELVVLAEPPTEDAAGFTAQAATGDIRSTVELSRLQFQQLAQNSAVARTYETQQPSFQAPSQVYWDEDTYAVVNASTLRRYGSYAPFPNEASATAYLQEAVATDPRLAGELLVVPSYQLDLASV